MSCLDKIQKLETDRHEVNLLETHHCSRFYLNDPVWLPSHDFRTFGLYLLLPSSALVLADGDTSYLRSVLHPGTSRAQARPGTCLSPPAFCQVPRVSSLPGQECPRERERASFYFFLTHANDASDYFYSGKSYYMLFLFRAEVWIVTSKTIGTSILSLFKKNTSDRQLTINKGHKLDKNISKIWVMLIEMTLHMDMTFRLFSLIHKTK